MRRIMAILLLSFLMAGCAGDKGKELFETAQFEEKQHNLEHAEKLYREIIEKHPGSDYAKMAEKRLAEMGKSR
ncbi:MAG: hypothetical protein NDI77_07870 [Geobacteraceae bacterium]|nr:hypothetical protein [Geobacteraceae bacterium]